MILDTAIFFFTVFFPQVFFTEKFNFQVHLVQWAVVHIKQASDVATTMPLCVFYILIFALT